MSCFTLFVSGVCHLLTLGGGVSILHSLNFAIDLMDALYEKEFLAELQMICPGFEPHQCLHKGAWKRMAQTPCWPSGDVQHIRLCQVRIRMPTLALKPRGDVTISPKQEFQWPHKKDLCILKSFSRTNILKIVEFQDKHVCI